MLREVFAFILGVENIEGTVLEKRIADYVAKGSTSASVYKLKADPRANLSRNRHMYTDEQIEQIKETCREFNYFYRYSSHPEEGKADPSTTFFEYGDQQHDAEKLESLYGGFLTENAAALARAVSEPSMNKFHFNRSYPVDIGMKTLGYPVGITNVKQ